MSDLKEKEKGNTYFFLAEVTASVASMEAMPLIYLVNVIYEEMIYFQAR